MFRKSSFEPILERVGSCVGTASKPSFKMKVNLNGRRSLVEDGVINTYEMIQSHKDSCDIEYIMTRFANGDTSVLSKAQGLYGDFSNIPTNLNELQQRVIDAEKLFYQLPVDTRERFEHNPSIFYSMIGSDAFNEIMGVDKVSDNPIKKTPSPTPSTDSSNLEQKEGVFVE